MKVLGALLAGGKSVRFGSDKALAMLDGLPLIAHGAQTLSAQCDAVILVGRQQEGFHCVPDHPAPDMGPLGGLAGALCYAHEAGFDAVLSAGIDAPNLPIDLLTALMPAPAYIQGQPVIGLWPVTALDLLDAILAGDERHSMMNFIKQLGARPVALNTPPENINTQADLAAIQSK